MYVDTLDHFAVLAARKVSAPDVAAIWALSWLGNLAGAAQCNWLVCLALWMAARAHSDAARLA